MRFSNENKNTHAHTSKNKLICVYNNKARLLVAPLPLKLPPKLEDLCRSISTLSTLASALKFQRCALSPHCTVLSTRRSCTISHRTNPHIFTVNLYVNVRIHTKFALWRILCVCVCLFLQQARCNYPAVSEHWLCFAPAN